jgi:hypothetical protein
MSPLKNLPRLTLIAVALGLSVPALAHAKGIELAQAAAADVDDTAAPTDDSAIEDAELDALLDVGQPAAEGEGGGGGGIKWSGYTEFGAAYTYRDPERWSHLRARGELGAGAQLAPRVRWKLTARAEADGAFDLEDEHYPAAVRRDQRTDFALREAYVDVGHGDWEFRLGRQHIIWGEMVGFFFADVVSARDKHDFLLPEFESMRIGQWAARAEYFGAENTHFELLWVPKPSFDEIGKPGSDFYAFPWLPAGASVVEHRPGDDLDNSNWGTRISRLVDGWDLSAFYYHSYDVAPTLHAFDGVVAELRHARIDQVGGTFSKDMGSFVLKGEAVHTSGRSLNTFTPLGGGRTAIGLAATDMVDYALGVDMPVGDFRFNVQYYGRWLDDLHPAMMSDRHEQGMTFQVVHGTGTNLEAEVLAVSSLNRSDYMLRPKLTWKFDPAWRMVAGLDVFGGEGNGVFSVYDRNDRAWLELRRWF